MTKAAQLKRQRSRAASRRELDRAMLRCLRQLSWNGHANGETLIIHQVDQVELVGLVLARRKVND